MARTRKLRLAVLAMIEETPTNSIFTRFFTLSSDIFVITNAATVVVRANPAVLHILGWTPAEFCGTRFLDYIHAEDEEAMKSQLEALPPYADTKFSARCRTIAGAHIAVAWTAAAWEDGLIYYTGRCSSPVEN